MADAPPAFDYLEVLEEACLALEEGVLEDRAPCEEGSDDYPLLGAAASPRMRRYTIMERRPPTPLTGPRFSTDPTISTTFSFGPAGTYSLFHAGVAYHILSHIPFDQARATTYVVSGGALGLSLLLFDDPAVLLAKVEWCAEFMAQLKRYRIPNLQVGRVCREALLQFYPDDMHERLGDRVYVGLTQAPPFQRVAACGPFPTKEALVDALLASSYIPLFFLSRRPAGYRDYIDGGFTHAFCPDPRTSVNVSVAHYPDVDVYHDMNRHHLTYLTGAEYMDVFWKGVRAAEAGHEVIVEKLRAQGMLLEDSDAGERADPFGVD